jgi:SHS2 domain-containing protein
MGTFEVFGLSIRGATLPDLLETAARAVFAQVLEDLPPEVETEEVLAVKVEGEAAGDLGELLVSWLQELLFRFETRRQVPIRFAFEAAAPDRVRARVGFGRFDPGRHRARAEIKGVTYHELDVHAEADGSWRARVILDV